MDSLSFPSVGQKIKLSKYDTLRQKRQKSLFRKLWTPFKNNKKLKTLKKIRKILKLITFSSYDSVSVSGRSEYKIQTYAA